MLAKCSLQLLLPVLSKWRETPLVLLTRQAHFVLFSCYPAACSENCIRVLLAQLLAGWRRHNFNAHWKRASPLSSDALWIQDLGWDSFHYY